MLALSELERARDDLAERLHDVRRTLSDRTWVEEQNRRLIEEMMLEPEKHKWVRVGPRTSASAAASTGTSARAGASSA